MPSKIVRMYGPPGNNSTSQNNYILPRVKNAASVRKVETNLFFFSTNQERRTMTEAAYQGKLIRKLKQIFPGCVVLKNDPQYQQGILDLTLLVGSMWAMLEVKASRTARVRPNQGYFVEQLDKMSFAAFIYPENEEEVLCALQEAFAS